MDKPRGTAPSEASGCGGTPEVEVTSEMIRVGMEAWAASAGDEYPSNSITNGLTVVDIYLAMKMASSKT
jgi:hypothetical protein